MLAVTLIYNNKSLSNDNFLGLYFDSGKGKREVVQTWTKHKR